METNFSDQSYVQCVHVFPDGPNTYYFTSMEVKTDFIFSPLISYQSPTQRTPNMSTELLLAAEFDLDPAM